LKPKIAKKSSELPIFCGFKIAQGHQCTLIPLDSSSAVLVTVSSKSMRICNCFHAGQANSGSGKITTLTTNTFSALKTQKNASGGGIACYFCATIKPAAKNLNQLLRPVQNGLSLKNE